MTSAQRRYIVVETAISIAINTAISIGFVYAVFGGTARIATSALIADAIPQSFMIALMATLVPTFLTRRRLRAGTIIGLASSAPKGSAPLALRALFAAVLAAIAGVAFHAFILGNFAPNGLTFVTALTFKASFAVVLTAIVTLWALRRSLVEGFG